jgi:hypothetical protein
MASIYESQGPQVALTGPGSQGGFQPGQAYDASSFMLRQSERDLAAFAQFSESLSGFIQEQAKKKNEQEYQLGLAEVLDGTVTPTPTQADQYQASATLLQDAASADNQVSNQLSNQGQLAAGEQFKAQSQAISGWRSYGRAVGSAKQVATNAQSFFLTWMENSKDKVVPTEDGRMISPAEAKSPAEIQAALAVGQQTLIKQSNIRNINPVIIAEHLAPTIQAVKGQMFANKLSSEVRKAKETAVSDITGVVRSEFSNPDLGIDGMAESFQRNVKAFEIEGGLSRGAASDTVIQEALDSIVTLPEEQATLMLEKLSQVRKIANDPKSLSLGSAYANMFGKALDTIEGRVEAEEAKNERKLGKQAEQAWGLLKKAEQDATLPAGELQALRKQTIGVLGQLADQGSTDALKYRTELLADPINVDYTLYRQYREGIAQGKRPSEEQIQRDIQSGKLTTEMGRELGVYATSSDQGDFKKQFGSSISDAVKAKLKEAGAVSLDPFNRPETNVLHVEQVTNDLVANVYRWRQSQLAKGQTPDDNDINQFVINELPRTIGRYFQQNPNTKAWTTRPLSRNPSLTPNQIKSSLSGPVRDASGFNPRTIQLRSYNSGSTVIMSKAEVEDNIQRMASNQPMTRRAEQLANSQGGPVQLLTNQAKHYGIDTKPILSSPEAQRLSQYSAAAPWATQRYNAAGGNYRQQMFQLQRIVEAQARAANAGKGPEPTVTVKSGPSVGTKDLIKLGLSQGLTPEKAITMAAVALGESGGRPGAHNPNRSTGDNSYGLWQINMIDELGPERARALGIKDYNQLKDPNVNARAMKMILNSQGLNAWSVHRNRLHLQYLPEARRAYAELKREM